jgi:hypothetical protein
MTAGQTTLTREFLQDADVQVKVKDYQGAVAYEAALGHHRDNILQP